jgi:hypothetical protein
MSFYDPKDLVVGNLYRLTEFVEGKEVSSGDYFLVSTEEYQGGRFPALGFGKVQTRKADLFLTEAHAQFGDNIWRHSFNQQGKWLVYSPAGAMTWNHSYVTVEDPKKEA